MIRNINKLSSFIKVGIMVLLLAFSVNALFLPPAQAGLGDSIRGAVNRVIGTAKPNLTVRITSADVRGESAYISYVVENNGDADTPWGVPIDIYFYINDEKRAQDSIPLMRTGSWSNKSKSVEPRFWKQGNPIRVEVDPLRTIDEKDENDNAAAASVTKDLYTDLYINKIEFSKDTVTQGEAVTVNVQIENRGSVKSNNPKIEVIINDTEKIAHTRSFIVPANGTNTASVDFRTDNPAVKLGRNLIRAWIEPGSHEANIEKMPLADHAVAYLEVKEKEKPKPNFVIEGAVNPKYIEQPVEISIWFSIFNKGPYGGPDSPSTTAVLYVNNERIKEFSVKALSPWIEPAKFEHKYNMVQGGKYEIKVVVDEANRIEELKEDDNTYIYTTALDEYIDLEAADLGISANTTLKEDGYVMVNAVVLNKGSVTADSLLSIYLDNRKVFGKTFTVAPNSKESWPEQVKIEVKNAGEHKITAEVVPYSHHEALERNKANNKKEYTVTILPPPLPYLKLEITDFGPAIVYTGDKIKASFVVTNTGEGSSLSPTFAQLLINNRVEKDFVVPVLLPAGRQTFSYDKVINEPGRYDVEVRISPQAEDIRPAGVKYDKIGFSSDVKEKEKEAEKEFIDLAIDNIEVSPAAPRKGEVIIIKFPIGNLGSREARGAAVIEYGGRQIYAESIYLAPQALIGSKVVEKRFKVEESGTYTIKAFVSPNTSYRDLEKNVENNSKEIKITVEEDIPSAADNFSEVKNAVNNLYGEFKSSYANGDVNGVLRCIDKEWESSGGQSFYDLDSRLNNIFSTFRQLSVEMSGFSVSVSDDPAYAARVDYFIKIEGTLFSDSSIRHHDEGQVSEYIKKEGSKYLISKTVGKGAF